MPNAARRVATPKSVAFGAAIVCLLAACAEQITQIGPDDIVRLRVAPDSVEVGVGKTYQVNALPLDDRGTLLVGQDVDWSSAATGIATVDSEGVVTGVAAGSTEITARVSGLEASLVVTVALPPVIALSSDSLRLLVVVGDEDLASGAIDISNTGELDLVGLTVDSVQYALGADGWLDASLSETTAPSVLEVEAETVAITTAGAYEATIWLSAPGADNSPAAVHVTLVVEADVPTEMEILAGDDQVAQVRTVVAAAPSVRVSDGFGNPVPGANVTFSVVAGGGSVTGGAAVTGGDGVATVGSWRLGETAGANRVSATSAGLDPLEFTAIGEAGPATRLVIASGNGQSAIAGEAVAAPLVVGALDAFANPVAGVQVVFSTTSGGGSVGGATQTTDAEGLARLGSWTLGATPGANSVRAQAASIPDAVTFTATGLTGEAVAIEYVAGDLQTDTVGATLSTAYAVRVVDAGGFGVSGVPVSWSVTGGGGSFVAETPSDADGIATARRVLGTGPGTHTATGAVGGLSGSPVNFSATATAGSAAAVEIVAGSDQSATVGTNVAVAPRLRVLDRFGNPVAGHPVTFSVTAGGGSVSPTGTVLTGSGGEASASRWTLGTEAGTRNNEVSGRPSGVGITGSPARFTASAEAGAPDAVAVLAGNGQTAVTGQAVSTSPSVRVTDEFGNPVSGVTVRFEPSGAGSVGSSTATTNASGSASTSWTVRTGGSSVDGQGRFANSLSATIQGTGTSTSFGAWAIYSYEEHVDPLWAAESCVGCHGGTSGLFLGGTPAENYDELVGVVPVCGEGGLASQYRVVSSAGGAAASDDFSILMRFVDPSLPLIGLCSSAADMVFDSSTNLAILRAWIRNGAPRN